MTSRCHSCQAPLTSNSFSLPGGSYGQDVCRPCLDAMEWEVQSLAQQIANVQAMARHIGREGRLPGSQALIDAVLALNAEVA